MMGFAVSTAAVFMTAWIVYAATRRAAYMDGYQAARRELHRVPAGTTHARKDATYEAIADATGWTGCPESVKRDHVALDDRIYGRNG